MGEQARRAPNHQGSTKICLGERPQEQPEDDRPGWEATSFENHSDEPGNEHHPYGIETVRRGIRPDNAEDEDRGPKVMVLQIQ